ncbi:MAG: deoxyribodipyrimidine photo-lyase, partial [Flavitalea sp.]
MIIDGKKVNIFWFRRDLRLHDNAGLFHALKDKNPVLPIFIFDTIILDKLEDKADSRVEFIHKALTEIHRQLSFQKSSIQVFYGTPEKIFGELLKTYSIDKVYTNHDYEPYAQSRDEAIRKLLNSKKISLHSYKDQVIFEKSEIVKDDASPYIVFTPYSRKWLATLNEFYIKPYPTEKYFSNLYKSKPSEIPTLKSMRFKKGNYELPTIDIPLKVLKKYKQERDFPGIDGTSRMGVHLRFGTISIRQLAKACMGISET